LCSSSAARRRPIRRRARSRRGQRIRRSCGVSFRRVELKVEFVKFMVAFLEKEISF